MNQKQMQKRLSNSFFITLVVIIIVMVSCSVPTSGGSSSSSSSESKTVEEVTMSGSFNIKVDPNVGVLSSSAISYSIISTEYTVTALDITVTEVSTSSVVGTYNWTPAVGATTYSVGISTYGEYTISVVQTAVNGSDTVTTEDSTTVNIQPMKVTVVTIVPGGSLDISVDDDGEPVAAPTIVSINPVDGATGIDMNFWALEITFSEEMQTGFSISMNGPEVEHTCRWSDSITGRFYFNLQEALQPNTTYTFTLNPSDHPLNFQNLAGIPLAADTTFSFTTGSTTTQPIITSSTIADGATNVEVDTDGITITFDQDMKTYSDSVSDNLGISATYHWLDSRNYRIDFNEDLDGDSEYTITLNPTGSVQGFRSINDVRLHENTTITFTTKPELYYTWITSSDIIIHDVTVERIADSIRLNVNYESGFERGYSVFNPPDGTIFMYINGTTGIFAGTNIFTIDIPVSEVIQTSEITMRFLDGLDTNDFVVVRTAAFSELLD